MTAAFDTLGNAGRGASAPSLDASRVIYETREKLARLFHAGDPRRIVFTANATESLNIALKGLFSEGDHVITTVLEHNSVLRPLYECRKKGVELTILGCDEKGRISYEEMESAVRDNTKAVVCTHASNLTGNMIDLERVGEVTRRKGILLVADASQTAGVYPVDVQKMGIDVLCFTGHKGMLGPQGTGGLYVRPGLTLDPYVLGGTGVKSNLKEMPEEMPLHLEAGTGNEPSYHGLLAALQWAEENPLDREKTEEILRYLKKGLRDLGCRVIRPEPPVTPVLSFTIPGWHPGEAGDILSGSYDIICRTGLHCSPRIMENLGTPQGTIRLSLSRFTKRSDADRVLEAVAAMCGDQIEET